MDTDTPEEIFDALDFILTLNDDVEKFAKKFPANESKKYINMKDNSGRSLLHYAVFFNRVEILKFLLSFGADPHDTVFITGEDCFHIAAIEGSLQALKILFGSVLNLNLNITDTSQMTPLMNAVYHGNLNVASAILEQGSDLSHSNFNINFQDDIGDTALHYATKKGSLKMIELLISGGADMNIKNLDGFDAFHYLNSEQKQKAVEFLIPDVKGAI